MGPTGLSLPGFSLDGPFAMLLKRNPAHRMLESRSQSSSSLALDPSNPRSFPMSHQTITTSRSLLLTGIVLSAALASAQTHVVYEIDKPAGASGAWGETMTALPDLNGDGVGELAVGGDHFSGGPGASIHSGVDGQLLFSLPTSTLPVFMGTNVTAIGDLSGDGVPELMMVGSQSGASNSPGGVITVHSGANGNLLHTWFAPPGLIFRARFSQGTLLLDDVNGDGSPDLLVRSHRTAAQWAMLSTATGQVLYEITGTTPTSFAIVHGAARLSDHNGDGFADFAVLDRANSIYYMEVRSGATGALLASHVLPVGFQPTGNGEPFVGIADQDGDGKRDILAGGTFTAYAAVISSADGSVIREWDCSNGQVPCMASKMVDAGDLDLDGVNDILAVELQFGSSMPLRVMGLSAQTGTILFEDSNTELLSPYSNRDRIEALPGVDPNGLLTFAIQMESSSRVSVRSFAPSIGTEVCSSLNPGQLTALGSQSLSKGSFVLHMEGATPNSPALFLVGQSHLPGHSLRRNLCVMGVQARMPIGMVAADGSLRQAVDLPSLGTVGGSLVFQGVYRSATYGKLGSSNAIQLRLIQ